MDDSREQSVKRHCAGVVRCSTQSVADLLRDWSIEQGIENLSFTQVAKCNAHDGVSAAQNPGQGPVPYWKAWCKHCTAIKRRNDPATKGNVSPKSNMPASAMKSPGCSYGSRDAHQLNESTQPAHLRGCHGLATNSTLGSSGRPPA